MSQSAEPRAAVRPRAMVELREDPGGVTQEQMLADYGFAQVAAWHSLGDKDRATVWQDWANSHWLATPEMAARVERARARRGL